MNLPVTLVLQDMIDALKLHHRPRKIVQVMIIFLLVLLLIAVPVGIYATICIDSSSYLYWVGSVAGALYLGLFYYLIVYTVARRQFKQSKHLSKPFESEFTEDAYQIRSDYGSSEMKYSEFHKWRYNEKVILLYYSDYLFQLIPKRAFSSDEERNKIIELLRAKIGKPK